MTQERHEAEDHPIETLYDGQWMRLKRRGRWEFAERAHGNGMAVIIIAVTPEDNVLFVEQYRVPLGKRTIECPPAWSATTTRTTPSNPPRTAS